ncbi:synaptic plasticity regulator PANTS [Xylocopa sonorina]|uniref:synaptic plasticity regulator PANTS n=1 Tax=Xylocopa sonorina TaxID=1818115 RepID=UPI00403B36F2
MPESNSTTENVSAEEERQYEWLIRPCTFYKEEYKDCKSIRARFHQYFVFGKTIDCTQWKSDYNNCYLWNKYKDEDAYEDLVESEKQRRFKRLSGHYCNDVWQKRDKPPEDWNAPLPAWLQEKNKNSYFRCVSEQLKNEQSKPEAQKSCTIM